MIPRNIEGDEAVEERRSSLMKHSDGGVAPDGRPDFDRRRRVVVSVVHGRHHDELQVAGDGPRRAHRRYGHGWLDAVLDRQEQLVLDVGRVGLHPPRLRLQPVPDH